MVNICNKFANDEGDTDKLHSAAVATQAARVVSCSDFNGECALYGECLNLVIAHFEYLSWKDYQEPNECIQSCALERP